MGIKDLFNNFFDTKKNAIVPTSENTPKSDSNELSTDTFPDWYISISFGKSSSENYKKAVELAKHASQYHEQTDDGVLMHQAIYSAERNDFLRFIMLYELVGNWKSSFVMINGKLVDRKIVSNIKYCYGDRCRSSKPNFCYGASFATENPFGCHRLQISNFNNPWWKYYVQKGNIYVLNRDALLERINAAADVYSLCPCFNYARIMKALDSLPKTMNQKQLQAEIEKSRMVTSIKV